MRTNLYVIANVKQLLTWVALKFYCFFFPNILRCWRPKFSNFLTVFKIGLSLARFFGGPSEFRGVGGLNSRNPPTPWVRHWQAHSPAKISLNFINV